MLPAVISTGEALSILHTSLLAALSSPGATQHCGRGTHWPWPWPPSPAPSPSCDLQMLTGVRTLIHKSQTAKHAPGNIRARFASADEPVPVGSGLLRAAGRAGLGLRAASWGKHAGPPCRCLKTSDVPSKQPNDFISYHFYSRRTYGHQERQVQTCAGYMSLAEQEGLVTS